MVDTPNNDPSADASVVTDTVHVEAPVEAVAAEPAVAEPAAETSVISEDQAANTAAPYKAPSVPVQRVQGDPVNEPLVIAAKNDGPVVAFPSATEKVLDAAQDYLPENFDPDPRWGVTAEMAETTSSDGEFEGALSDGDRDWRRVMDHKGKRIGAQNLNTPSITGKEVAGDAALMAYRSHARSSAGASIQLWGSGITVKFNALANEALYHLSREIASSRITAGRSTYGVALSQHMVYTAEAMLDAAKTALFKSSLQGGVDLGDVIRVTDFSTMVWGLAVATFPHGFDIERACIADPGGCQHVVKERVMVRRMQVVDWTALSDEQRDWMSTLQDGKHTIDDVKPYQDKFARVRTRDYTIDHPNGGVTTITLKVPTLNEFISAGKLWIDDVNRATITAIGESASFAERNRMMGELMRVANARQYSHWVEAISFDGGKIIDPASIRRILAEEISGDDGQLTAFIKAVRDFSEKMATSVIAINNYKCPACGKHQMQAEGHEGQEEQPPIYVPVESVSTFFALMYQKLALAQI